MKKSLSVLVGVLMLAASAWAQGTAPTPKEAWDVLYPQVEARIKAPTFRDVDYRIFDYGKESRTEGYLYHDLINKVIDKCSSEGGGRVIIPAGTWLCGPITLKSNVNLHLEEGATLLFTFDLSQYPLVRTRWEGVDCYNYQPMIYAYEQENIAVTGKGTIDGGGTRETWWAMCGAERFGFKPDTGMISQRIGRPILLEWNEKEVPLEQRKLGDGYGMRVQLLSPTSCKNVLIEDVTLLRAPFWVIHPVFCQNLTVRGVHVQNDGPNGDGCDPESCKDVLIEGCYFDTGDDCIAIKSGRNRDGRRAGIATENVIVRKCRMKNGHGGIVIGSEIAGGFKNLFCEDCDMDSPDLERVVRIKTNSCRGGVIEDVFVRNVRVGQCREAVLKINLNYDPKEICQRDFPPTVRNVYLENVNCKKSKFGVRIDAFKDVCKVFNVEVKDCDWTGVETDGNSISGMVDDVRFINLKINGHNTIENESISTRMALSEMKRNPYSWMVDHCQRSHWSYSVGAELDGILAAGLRDGNKKIQEYVLSYVDTVVNPEGKIKGYRPTDQNIDHVKNGRLLFSAYDLTNDPRLLVAIDTLYGQLQHQPRTKSGGFWHKKIYPNQMWLDGLYMGEPFYLEYANRRLTGKEQKKAYDDIAKQFLLVAKHTYDPATGLYRHAWDESKKMFWADKKTGQSAHAWGRAQGWYIWALVDVLENFPQDHPKRKELLKVLRSVADGIVKYQDPETGVWYQVLDEPGREGNYLEATASSMYVANILRAVRLGLLPESYLAPALKGYQGILDQFISTAADGTISLEQCCAVAGLGPDKNPKRDGSFEYYLSEPIRANDGKGVGAFILAAIEAERLGK